MTTPLIFFVFNRPHLTARVLARIRLARPPKLLVVCDGARPHVAGEADHVAAVRAVIARGVDWPCEVLRNYAEENMGCRARVSSGLSWAFSLVEEAVILEDDCLPDATFFPFCEEMLERYRGDPRVLHVGASNFTANSTGRPHSYEFSRYGHIWGWATWRRAWQLYEWDVRSWTDPATRAAILSRLDLADERGYWGFIFDRCAAHPEQETTWDYQWTYSCWKHDGLAIRPHVHLVQNIGLGAGATHTLVDDPVFGRAAAAISFPLRHPREVRRDAAADRDTFRTVFVPERRWLDKAWRRFTSWIRRFA